MVNSCSANGCKNRNTKGGTLTFHRFPLNNKHLLKLWLYQIKRGNWEPSKYSVICSEHFPEGSFVVKGQNNRRTLKNDAIPTVFSIANYTEPPKKKKNPKERLIPMDVEEDKDPEVAEKSSESKDVEVPEKNLESKDAEKSSEFKDVEVAEKSEESSTSKTGDSSPQLDAVEASN